MAGVSAIFLDYQGPMLGKYLDFGAMDPGLMLSAHAYLSEYVNFSVNTSFVPNTTYPSTKEKYLQTSLIDVNTLLQFKANNGRIFKEDAFFAPYFSTGLGLNSASNITRVYIPAVFGLRLQLSEGFGLGFEGIYKQAFSKKDFQHIALTGGFVFSLPTQKQKKSTPSKIAAKPNNNKNNLDQSSRNPTPKSNDRDGDGVLDEIDECPDKRGTITYRGCPPPSSKTTTPESKPEIVVAQQTPQVNPSTPPAPTDLAVSAADQNFLNRAMGKIYFEKNTTVIKKESFSVLDSIALIMQKYPDHRLEVTGYTDDIGNNDSNKIMSVMRGFEVKYYLVKNKGILMKRIISDGNGAEKASGDPGSESIRSKSRRVELKLLPPLPASATPAEEIQRD